MANAAQRVQKLRRTVEKHEKRHQVLQRRWQKMSAVMTLINRGRKPTQAQKLTLNVNPQILYNRLIAVRDLH